MHVRDPGVRLRTAARIDGGVLRAFSHARSMHVAGIGSTIACCRVGSVERIPTEALADAMDGLCRAPAKCVLVGRHNA